MLECPSEEQLASYVAGTCTAEQTAAIEAHLSSCTRCGEWVERVRAADVGETIPSDHLAETQASAEGAAAEAPSPSIPGYELVKEAHRGGQGVVYQAIQKSTKRRVAIKVMHEGPFAGPPDKARFEREVQVLGQLNHPNIVAIHDSGTAAGSFYYVMDYISGRSLDDYITLTKPSIDDALHLFAKICDAVNAAHLRGVIHRDLKPSNIRIDADGQPHILDFGLAKIATGQVTNGTRPQVMTLTGQFFGSLPWASPEQAEAIPSKIDLRTDVYSLGVVFYQMMTGRFPYEVVGNIRDVMDRIMNTEPARPSTIRRQINDEVETIILKSLSKERDRRYQSAGELARDVWHYLAGEPIEAKRDSGWYVLKKWLRQRRTYAAAVLVIVALAAVSGWAYWESGKARHSEEIAQRHAWVAALRGFRLAGEGHDAAGRAAERLWQVAAQGQATDEEIREVISTAVKFRFFTRRSLLSLAQLPRANGQYRAYVNWSLRWVPPEFALLGDVVLKLNGRADGLFLEDDTVLADLGEVSWGSMTSNNIAFDIPRLQTGRHVISGTARVRVARFARAARSDSKTNGYDCLDLPEVELLIGPYAFTVVEQYPSDYPMMIEDECYTARFIQETRIRAMLSTDAGAGRELPDGTHLPLDVLILELSFPVPPIEIACSAQVSMPELGIRADFRLIAGPAPSGGGLGIHEFWGTAQSGGSARIEDARWVLDADWVPARLLGTSRASDLAGKEVVLEIEPSRRVARESNEEIERFLGVSGVFRATIVETRKATRIEAERLVAGLYDEMGVPDQVIEHLRVDSTLSEPIRAQAIALARLHAAGARDLNEYARSALRSADRDSSRYESALRAAERACSVEPANWDYLNTLGVAQYRVGAYEEALATLQRSDELHSARYEDGIPKDVAFIAMTLHQLGRAEEARQQLERLRALMPEERWAGDEESQAFLREAETLLATPLP